MRSCDVEDAFNVAGVDEIFIIFLHFHSKLCIAQHSPELIDTHICILVSYKLNDAIFH